MLKKPVPLNPNVSTIMTGASFTNTYSMMAAHATGGIKMI